jgi:MinD superfamily P-loop ATPase
VKQIVVLSGKGGTGKTSVMAALADLASRDAQIVLGDADVDAANLALVLAPEEKERHDFVSGKVAVIDGELCTACGRCAEICRFDAVSDQDDYRVDPVACEGCAACFYQCPVEAIAMQDCTAGIWSRAETAYGVLFHAHLYAGQENSGKLVTRVKQEAALWANDHDAAYVILDGPPGIGCPVIAACAGADLALLVVEPTVSGVHDLERVLATVQHFGVAPAVVVNKCDINPQRTEAVATFCRENDIPMVGRIPFDTVVTEAMVQGRPVTAVGDSEVARELARVWAPLRGVLSDN